MLRSLLTLPWDSCIHHTYAPECRALFQLVSIFSLEPRILQGLNIHLLNEDLVPFSYSQCRITVLREYKDTLVPTLRGKREVSYQEIGGRVKGSFVGSLQSSIFLPPYFKSDMIKDSSKTFQKDIFFWGSNTQKCVLFLATRKPCNSGLLCIKSFFLKKQNKNKTKKIPNQTNKHEL